MGEDITRVEQAPAGGAQQAAGGAGAAAGGEKGYDPEKFDNQIEYWLSCIGFAVGYGNVWRFPYMCYSNGGAVFLIPYLLSLLLIAIPMYLLETAYGQLIDARLQTRYGVIVHKWWSVSIAQVMICGFFIVYYITLMAYSFSFFFDSFTNPLPWLKDGADEATAVENLWNSDYFNYTVLRKSPGINELGSIRPWLVLCMFLSYVMNYFSAWKGLKSTGKMVYVTCLLPYLMLTILLIKGLSLEGAGTGLRFLFVPDWSKLWDIQVWKAAGTQIIFSSGVGYGPLMYYGTGRQKTDKLITASFLIPVINSATSLYAALTIFSFLGHVAERQSIPIADLAQSGPELVFVGFPALIGLLDGANFWAVVFFGMLIVLGVDSVFAYLDFFLVYFEDSLPHLTERYPKELVCAGLCCVCFVFSLMFCAEGGLYVFTLFDEMSSSIALMTCVLFELLFIPWLFGVDKLEVLMLERTGEKIPAFAKIAIKTIVPAFILMMFVLSWIYEFSPSTQETRNWPTGILWLGRLIWIVPFFLVPLGHIWQIECPNIYDLIEEQYGIRFNQDGSHHRTKPDPFKQEAADGAAKEANL